ncbi:hypothetical protein CH063_15182 [Colletotrichum higginsianum]|uniref:Uncharacterized protein n=1 Tax=Colletotrichum higginsianum (strain IMI 349063) TaxID=759273 RepID=H1W1S3_COLHI|nr:hypothetical protein CH063_15182 [Colletotrichum higginsianum]
MTYIVHHGLSLSPPHSLPPSLTHTHKHTPSRPYTHATPCRNKLYPANNSSCHRQRGEGEAYIVGRDHQEQTKETWQPCIKLNSLALRAKDTQASLCSSRLDRSLILSFLSVWYSLVNLLFPSSLTYPLPNSQPVCFLLFERPSSRLRFSLLPPPFFQTVLDTFFLNLPSLHTY